MLTKNGQFTRTEGHDSDEVGTLAEFYENARTGKPHIRFRFAGDKHFSPDFEATEFYQRRFPKQWSAFSEGRDQLEGQTPIEHVAWIDEGMAGMLRYELNIQTVEQLADVTDANLPGIGMGAGQLRDKAREHVLEKGALEQNSELRSELDELKAQMAQLQAAQKGGAKKQPARQAA